MKKILTFLFRFQNEDSDENPLFLSTAPTSLISDINKKSNPDWLGETFDTNSNNRPRPNSMEGSLNKKSCSLSNWFLETYFRLVLS